MQLLPAIDVLGGEIVRLHQGDYELVTAYGDDVVGQARAWLEQGVAMIHLVDLDGARHGTPARHLWSRLAAAGIPFQVGGGIRRVEDAVAAREAGATRVMMGTAAVWEPQVLAGAVDRLGPAAVMASIDVASGRARGAGWLDEGRDLPEVVAGCIDAGVERFLVTAVARDGTMKGPDLALIAEIQRLAPGVAIVAAGGIGSLRHLTDLAALGIEGAVAGRALYEGAFTIEEALRELTGPA